MIKFKRKVKDANDSEHLVNSANVQINGKVKKISSELHRKKLITGIACVLCAVILLALLFPQLIKSNTDQYDLIKLTKDIKQGQQITSDCLVIEKTTDKKTADKFINTSKDIVNKFASFDMVNGQYVLPSNLWETDQTDMYSKLENGQMAISVSFESFASSLSGKIRQGDIVSILGILTKPNQNENEEYKAITMLRNELKYVEVLAVTNEETQTDITEDFDNKSVEDTAKTLSTVTLLVTESQAKLLVDFENTGYLHLALIHRGDNDIKEQLLTQQKEYNEKLLLETDNSTSSTDGGTENE